ncbi:MAG: SH3 domain-containing protein [Planctomycetota bacterium]|nr:SH3 domain-containing protein [Planctomycetota bacterium]MDI6788695.1 SH3 domain-containing protein [Planctomycetota bacterium]
MVKKKIWNISGWLVALATLGINTLVTPSGWTETKGTSKTKTAEPQEVVEVTVGKLNLRAGAGTNYPVIRLVAKGEKLVVVNDQKGWLEVRIPENTKCWITKKYVERVDKKKSLGVVKVGRINVRSSPQTGENIIGHINEGTTVKITGEKGEWYQITPTDNLTGWTSKKHTRYWGTYKRYLEVVSQKAQDEMAKQTAMEIFNQAEQLYQDELQKPPLQQSYATVLRLYKEVIDKSSDKELNEKCSEKIRQLEPKEEILKEYRKVIVKATSDKQAIEKKYKDRLEELYRRATAPEPYNAKGWVESVGKYIGRPSAYKLSMGGKTIFFLKSASFNMDDYYCQYVGVRGKIVETKPGQDKIILVDKIDILTEGE